MSGALKQISMEKEYEKNKDITPEDIQKLRSWLATQPHLPGKHITDLDLLLIFYCCKGSPEISKQVLDLHYTLRTIFTAFFKDRDVDNRVETCLKHALIAPLPQPAEDGTRFIYACVLDSDPKHFNFGEIVRTFMMIFDLWQYEEGTWPGLGLVIDMKRVVLGHITKLDLMILRQTVYFLQECMLVKLKAIHFLNAPSFMDKLLMLLKPIMSKELYGKLHMHVSDSDKVENHIPLKALPKECGGSYLGYRQISENTIRRLHNNKDLVKEDNFKRVNESLRPGGRADVVDLFSIQGSFKKLDID